MPRQPQLYFLQDDGLFPNSQLPVVLYKEVLKLPAFFAAHTVRKLFQINKWTNNWRNGIYVYDHYHSITHEAMAVVKGDTQLMLGGPRGTTVEIARGDVIVIPAGVAHRNLGREKDVICDRWLSSWQRLRHELWQGRGAAPYRP
ncbi:MAG: hypothetical protein JSS82_11115 [Bacteroidetes bacterium]|nr:hypothetical protein [Bacteroidota bacterium]